MLSLRAQRNKLLLRSHTRAIVPTAPEGIAASPRVARALIAWSRLEPRPSDPRSLCRDEWELLAGLAIRHGTGPLLYQAVRGLEGVPGEVVARLGRQHAGWAWRNHRTLSEALLICRRAAEAGIPVIALKGVALIAHIYGSAALRPLSDVDLLIHREDFGRLRALLGELGFAPSRLEFPESFYRRHYRELSFAKTARVPVTVDVQWNIMNRFRPEQPNLARLWERKTETALAGGRIFTFAVEDLLLHAALHLARHVPYLASITTGRDTVCAVVYSSSPHLRLLWLVDLLELSRHADLSEVVDVARQEGLDDALRTVLAVIAKLDSAPQLLKALDDLGPVRRAGPYDRLLERVSEAPAGRCYRGLRAVTRVVPLRPTRVLEVIRVIFPPPRRIAVRGGRSLPLAYAAHCASRLARSLWMAADAARYSAGRFLGRLAGPKPGDAVPVTGCRVGAPPGAAPALLTPAGFEQRRYQFFDTGLLVRSEIPEVVSLLDGLFVSFAVPEDAHHGEQPGKADLVCSVGRSHAGSAEIRVDGREYRVARQRDAAGLAYMVILRAALRRIRSHLLLHAGVVERRGRGVVLVGGSGAGKSTLVLELVRRGFRLLSDEIAAVRVRDGWVDPFPRSLAFREGGPLDREPIGVTDETAAMPLIGGGQKVLIQPAALGPDRMGGACPAALLVVLPSGPERHAPDEYLHVVFSELPAGLRGALETLAGISAVECVPNRLFPELRFRSRNAGEALRTVDAACARFGVAILETSRGDTRAVHTSGTPTLTPLSKREAARALLRHLHVAQDSALVQHIFGGSGARLLLQLAGLVEGMRCVTLSVGSLAERADLIRDALDEIEEAESEDGFSEGINAVDLTKSA